jgi:CheY-like chemotaxis protein
MTIENYKRILIVEDEPLLAMDLEFVLLDAGYKVTGITGKVEKAIQYIEEGLCDVAILDANLAGVSSEPIADKLLASNLPFMVLSGYLTEQLPKALRSVPLVSKPWQPTQILKTLSLLIDAQIPNKIN